MKSYNLTAVVDDSRPTYPARVPPATSPAARHHQRRVRVTVEAEDASTAFDIGYAAFERELGRRPRSVWLVPALNKVMEAGPLSIARRRGSSEATRLGYRSSDGAIPSRLPPSSCVARDAQKAPATEQRHKSLPPGNATSSVAGASVPCACGCGRPLGVRECVAYVGGRVYARGHQPARARS